MIIQAMKHFTYAGRHMEPGEVAEVPEHPVLPKMYKFGQAQPHDGQNLHRCESCPNKAFALGGYLERHRENGHGRPSVSAEEGAPVIKQKTTAADRARIKGQGGLEYVRA